MSKITEKQIEKAIELRQEGKTVKQIMNELGLDSSNATDYNAFRARLYRNTLKVSKHVDYEDAKPCVEYDGTDVYKYYEKSL